MREASVPVLFTFTFPHRDLGAISTFVAFDVFIKVSVLELFAQRAPGDLKSALWKTR